MTVSEQVGSVNSDRASFGKSTTGRRALSHRIAVYITSKREVRRIGKRTELTGSVCLGFTRRTSLMMYEVAAAVLTPPHVFGKLIVGHIPTAIFEECE